MNRISITIDLMEETVNLLDTTSDNLGLHKEELIDLALHQYVDSLRHREKSLQRYREENNPQTVHQPLSGVIPFVDLLLSVRVFNIIRRYFKDENELLTYDRDPVGSSGIRNLGIKGATEIAAALNRTGYDINDTVWKKYLQDSND